MTGRLWVDGVDVSSLFSTADDEGVTSAGTHDGGGAVDLTTSRSWSIPLTATHVNPDLLRLLGVTADRARQQFDVLMEYLLPDLPPEPVRPAGRAAVGYRRARRRYGRAVKRWRRAGSPKRQHALYVPHAHVTIHNYQEDELK